MSINEDLQSYCTSRQVPPKLLELLQDQLAKGEAFAVADGQLAIQSGEALHPVSDRFPDLTADLIPSGKSEIERAVQDVLSRPSVVHPERRRQGKDQQDSTHQKRRQQGSKLPARSISDDAIEAATADVIGGYKQAS